MSVLQRNSSRFAALLLASSGLVPCAATAQDADVDSSADIIVSAQRLNQSQVTGGGNIGVFGNKAAEDIPFNVRSYNEALILNQQPDSLGEVLENDPTIRTTLGFGIAGEVFVIRGFDLASDDVGFDGLYGITPRQLIAPELFSSVQVINGASAFINGAAPGGSGIGGSVNLIPKMADRALTRATVGFTSASQFAGSFDVARRFGANEEWGLRVNGSAKRGDIAIDDEFHSSYVAGATLDYNSGPLRASLNVNYQKLRQTNWRPKVGVTTAIPRVPDADTNYAQPWTYTETRDIFGTFNLEYDIADNAMIYARAGARDGREESLTSSITVADADAVTGAGAATASGGGYVPRTDNNEAAMAGIRIKLEGGGLSHEFNFGTSLTWQVNRNAYAFYAGSPVPNTNIYEPVDVLPGTVVQFQGGNLDNPEPVSRTRLFSVFASDTIGFWNDRILITGGLRLQEIKITSYSVFGDTVYKENGVSPVVGLVVKPVEGLSLYFNRIEGLVQGSSAGFTVDFGGTPVPVTNGGQVLPPVKSVQYEIGGKLSFGQFNAGIALFQIDKPNTFYRLDADNPGFAEYGNFGTQRNRGVEFTINGEPTEGLRIIAGLTFNDAELRRTDGGLNEGNDAVGVPEVLGNANVEWDMPFLPALTVTGRVVYTGKQAVDAANTLELDSWTRFDLGARYVALLGNTPLTLRFNVDNVANKRYWASAYTAFPTFGSTLLQGGPRTFKASATVAF